MIPSPPRLYSAQGQLTEPLSAQRTLLKESKNLRSISLPWKSWNARALYRVAWQILEVSAPHTQHQYDLLDIHPSSLHFDSKFLHFDEKSDLVLRHPLSSSWKHFQNFIELYLYPLYLLKNNPRLGMSELYQHRHQPDSMYQSISLWQKFSPPGLGLISIPYWLGQKATVHPHKWARNEKISRESIALQLKFLKFYLMRLEPSLLEKQRPLAPHHPGLLDFIKPYIAQRVLDFSPHSFGLETLFALHMPLWVRACPSSRWSFDKKSLPLYFETTQTRRGLAAMGTPVQFDTVIFDLDQFPQPIPTSAYFKSLQHHYAPRHFLFLSAQRPTFLASKNLQSSLGKLVGSTLSRAWNGRNVSALQFSLE